MTQTDKDFRLLVAELALDKLGHAIHSKTTVRPGLSRDPTNDILSQMDSNLKKLKFSYMDPQSMANSPMVEEIFSDAKSIYEAYAEAIDKGMGDLNRATNMWCFNVLAGLKRRLGNAGTLPCHGIDIVAVTIRNISNNEKLFTTRCTAGQRDFTIVTNLEGLKSGDTLAAALLPPAIVGGTASEAMFLGAENVDARPGTLLDPEKVNAKGADSVLYNELKAL